uniref:Uncharacterized protein n=1 Tax=Sus scrofa TaxID=9823 RepID=A0A8D0N4F4_PIG
MLERVWRSVEKREPFYTTSGNVSWCSHYAKHYGSFLKKLKIELSYDPAIPPLGLLQWHMEVPRLEVEL